jgi:hypothetical protein
LLYELFNLIQTKLQFNFTFIPTQENGFGTVNASTGIGTGQIGMIIRNEIDLSATDAAVQLDRTQV